MARSHFEENLGRMQSGGAITSDEEDRFKKMAPTVQDSTKMQIQKLKKLKEVMSARLQTALGKYTPPKKDVKVKEPGTLSKSEEDELAELEAWEASLSTEAGVK